MADLSAIPWRELLGSGGPISAFLVYLLIKDHVKKRNNDSGETRPYLTRSELDARYQQKEICNLLHKAMASAIERMEKTTDRLVDVERKINGKT